MARKKAGPRRFYIVVGRGERMRTVTLPPAAFYIALAVVPLVATAAVFGAYMFYAATAPSLDAINADRAEIRAAYDDRIAALQEQMNLSVQLGAHERETLDNSVRRLERRQTELDAQATTLGRIAQTAGVAADPTTARSGSPPLPPPSIALGNEGAADGVAPVGTDSVGSIEKPQPDGIEIRSSAEKTSALDGHDGATELGARLASLDIDADRLQKAQVGTVEALADRIARSASTARNLLASVGLSADRFTPAEPDSAVGGPFIPIRLGDAGTPLQVAFEKLETEVAANQRIAAALPRLPVRVPLGGALEITSPFGARLDPFLGQLAFHPGDDFRAPVGAPVHATAAGRVTIASYDGGYGNLVEIDHGDGLVTRYGHLSTIEVRVGQTVAPGQEVGRVGATGRATGPHLHYEVRIDGKPVDPHRFVVAGQTLTASR